VCALCLAEERSPEDTQYVTRFLEKFHKVDPAPTLDAYAAAAKYDAVTLGENLDKELKNVNNDQGGIAWVCLTG